MIRVAIIGTSGYGRVYLDIARAQAALGRLKVVAACIVNRTKHLELWNELSAQGIRCFEESATMWHEMKGQVDLTLLPTPQHTHLQYTLEALTARSHVLVEKPIATSLADAKRMAEAATTASRRLFVGFQDLYSENNWKLKRELSQGKLGEINSISFLGLWPRPASYYSRNQWAGKLNFGNQLVNDTPVSNAFAHFLNLCLFFAGRDEMTSATGLKIQAELFRANEIETFDTAALRINTDTGIPIHFFCSHASEKNFTPTIRIVTESATIVWRHEEGILVEREGREDFRKLPSGISDTRTPMLMNILSVLQGGRADICAPKTALAPLVINELLRSVRVQPVSPSRLRRIAMPEDSLVAIDGIEETLTACFESDLLPAETVTRAAPC